MLALGRRHRWPPAYYRELLFDDLELYLWDANREIAAMNDRAKRSETDVGYREDGFPAPTAEEAALVPWSGEGPDPLEELWNA